MIGSKSPIAYTESYELTTIANGVCYEYEIVRQLPSPTATLLNSFETNKKSGTTVRVEINPDDRWLVYKAAKRQLAYFDEVIVFDDIYSYDNEFKIIDHPLFRVRSDVKDLAPFGTQMHIVIGQVAYPIDWNIIGLNIINIPVAVKFDISELPVNLNRESIRYVEDTENGIDIKTLVKKRVLEVFEVLEDMYIKNTVSYRLSQYIDSLNDPKDFIIIAGYKIPFKESTRGYKRTLSLNDESYSFSKEYIPYLFKAFEGINLAKRQGSNSAYFVYSDITARPHQYVYSETGRIEHWNSLYYNHKILIRRKPFTRHIIEQYAEMLGLLIKTNKFGRIRKHIVTGGIKKIYYFVKHIEYTLSLSVSNYDSVPQSFIDEEKAKQQALLDARKGSITYYDANNGKSVIPLKSLMDDYEYVFYHSKDAPLEEKLAYEGLYKSLPSKYNEERKSKSGVIIPPRILMIFLAPSIIKKVQNKTKFLSISTRNKTTTVDPVTNEAKITKEWVKTTRQVYAFLSADKMFKYKELFSHFHILRRTTILYLNNFHNYNLKSVSTYYYSIESKLEKTHNYRISSPQERYVNVYPYLYFKEQIDALGDKGNNIIQEDCFNKLLEISDHLYYIGMNNKEDSELSKLSIKYYIKKHKLTKLNPKFYKHVY